MKLPLLQAHHGAGAGAGAGTYREEPRARTDALARMAPAWQLAPMTQAPAAGAVFEQGAGPAQYVYMISDGIRPSFPSLSVEKAFRQALPADDASSPLTNDMLFGVLGRTQNLYIAREMCWISSAQGAMNYVVAPQSHEELLSLIATIDPGDEDTRPGLNGERSADVALPVLIGVRGPAAPAAMCNGVALPVLMCARVVSLTWNSMVATIEQSLDSLGFEPPEGTTTYQLATFMWKSMYQMSSGDGDSDSKRAMVYVAVNYMDVYTRTYRMMLGKWGDEKGFPEGVTPATYTLASVSAMPASVQGDRKLVNIVFHYQRVDAHYGANTQQYACTVDVTGLFPFISLSMSLYIPSPM